MQNADYSDLPEILLTDELTDELTDQLRNLVDDDTTVFLLEGVDHVIAFKAPTRSQYKRFQSSYEMKNKRESASAALVNEVLVYPKLKAFEILLETMPAYQDSVVVGALRSVGTTPDVSVKKL